MSRHRRQQKKRARAFKERALAAMLTRYLEVQFGLCGLVRIVPKR